jgi:hypothetical protein
MQHNSFNKSKQCKLKEVIVTNVKCEDRQMSNINRWVLDVSREHRFPYWKGIIFCSENKEEQKENVKRIYDLAYEEELSRIVKKGEHGGDSEILLGSTKLDFHYVKKKGRFYDESKLSKQGFTDKINEDGLSLFDDCEEQCRFSYYNLNGQVVTEWIGCFATLHANLRSEKYVNVDKRTLALDDHSLLPVTIDYYYNRDKECQEFEIFLNSDIWFPRVVGWLDSEELFYDNSELAALHTPRLNRFLQRTKELISSLGGEWELVGEKPVPVDEYDENDVHESYYPYGTNPRRIIPTKIICIDGVQKEVYPPLSNYMGVENIPPECQLSEDGISLKLDVKPRNHWCMLANKHGEDHLPIWEANFPAGRFTTYEDTWPFVKTILEVGQQEEIFRIFEQEEAFRRFIRDIDTGILHVPDLESFCYEALESFYYREAYYRTIPDTEEELGVVDKLPEYTRNIQSMTTKISSYEKDGRLMDTYVKEQDLGRLLYNYHLGSLGRYQEEYKRKSLNPYYGCLDFYEHFVQPEDGSEGYHLAIKLTSDIWLPLVEGSLERKVVFGTEFNRGVDTGADEKARYQGGFDNRELANRHTPRLNRFLSAIAAKVIEMGGEWLIGEHVDPKYKEQMTLTGIKLDV